MGSPRRDESLEIDVQVKGSSAPGVMAPGGKGWVTAMAKACGLGALVLPGSVLAWRIGCAGVVRTPVPL